MRRARPLALLALAITVALLNGCTLSGGAGPATVDSAPEPPSPAEARDLLAREIPTRPETEASSYSRDLFPHWSDAEDYGWTLPAATPDPDSCDARDAALIRDAQDVRVETGCDVEGGEWLDPYTGRTYRSSSDIDIDHLVPLAEAWRSGASAWDPQDLERYANDPYVLLSVEDNANQEKSDADPQAWRPPNRSYHCEYARRWIGVKAAYPLSADSDEKAALQEMLDTC